MNAPDLSALTVLYEASTPEPWSQGMIGDRLINEVDNGAAFGFITVTANYSDDGAGGVADAEWIAAAHHAFPGLLAEAARARTLEAALRDLADSVAAHDIAAVAAVTDWQAYASKQIAITQARALLDTQEGP